VDIVTRITGQSPLSPKNGNQTTLRAGIICLPLLFCSTNRQLSGRRSLRNSESGRDVRAEAGVESRSDGTPANHKKQSEPRAEREGARGDCYTLMPRPPVSGLTPYAVAGCRPLLSSGLHYLLFVSRGCARSAGLPLPPLLRPFGTQIPLR
jgi:hypothetical protein